MIPSVQVFTRDSKGVHVFEVCEAESFGQAINMVKEHTGAERALCLVPKSQMTVNSPMVEDQQTA